MDKRERQEVGGQTALGRNCGYHCRQSVHRLAAEGSTRAVIAAQLGIGEATVYRILAEGKAQHP